MNTRLPLILITTGLLSFCHCDSPVQSGQNENLLQGSEIALNEKYWDCISAEPELNEQDVISAINRNYDIMDFNDPEPLLAYMLAVLADTITTEIVSDIKNDIQNLESVPEQIAAINEYTSTHFTHTQTEAIFADIPWHDPWGLDLNSDSPRYKKLLPSEMKAMARLTGKISGKCMTLAHLISGIFYWLGSDQNNIVNFVTQNPGFRHGNCILTYKDSLIFTNNQYLSLASCYPNHTVPGPIVFLGFYNHETILNKSYTVTDSLDIQMFSRCESVLASVCNEFNINSQDITNSYQLEHHCTRRELIENIYCNQLNSNLAFLSKYAAQSLYVKHPEYYLKASMQCSGPKDLAATFGSPDDLFSWLQSDLGSCSIFPESGDHIMTADQVLIFKTGSLKDQSAFAFTILTHMGFDPVLYLGLDDAVITFNDMIFSFKNYDYIEKTPENIIIGPLSL